jgi:hypothetical protein
MNFTPEFTELARQFNEPADQPNGEATPLADPAAGKECCGQPCPTRFCPRCGKKVLFLPLMELLQICRNNEKIHKKKLEEGTLKTQKYSGQESDKDYAQRMASHAKFVETWKRTVEKWKVMGDALEELINKSREQPP